HLAGGVDAMRTEPPLRVGLEGDPSCPWVDVPMASHVRSDLCKPLLSEPLLSVREALGLLGAVGTDVPGAVAHAGAVPRGLDLHGLAVWSRLGLVPTVLDVPGHQAASSIRESTQARTSVGSKRRCRPTRKPRGPVRLRRHW